MSASAIYVNLEVRYNNTKLYKLNISTQIKKIR
jgi:hypothetical protein